MLDMLLDLQDWKTNSGLVSNEVWFMFNTEAIVYICVDMEYINNKQ